MGLKPNDASQATGTPVAGDFITYYDISNSNAPMKATVDTLKSTSGSGTFTTLVYSTSISDGTTTQTASTLELNRANDVSGRLVAGGGTLSLTEALHDGKTILFDTAAGTVLTLPASSGSGAKFRCVVSVLATSNSHIVQCVGTDMMQGACGIIDTDTGDATILFAALVGDTFDTITMNRTTTGLAAPGDWVELEDVVAGVWAVRGVIRASGAVATPFSSAV